METFIDRKKMQLIAASCRKSCKTFKKRQDWFIRIKTPLPPLTARSMKQEISDKLSICKAVSWQICLEGTNETDHHIQMCVKFSEKNPDIIKQWSRTIYDEMISKNQLNVKKISTFYSCVRIRENAIRAMAYNYKEDTHVLEFNCDEEDVKIAKMLSHGKDLRQLSKKMEDLKEKYYRNEILDKELTEKIILLKGEFNQDIYINRIEAQVRYMMIRKHPVYAKTWASQIIDKIKEGN